MTFKLYETFDGLGLTAKQEEFVVQYCSDYSFNGTRAYLESFGTENVDTAKRENHRLLQQPKIREAVQREMRRKLKDVDELAQRIIDEHAKIAFAHSILIAEGWNPLGVLIKDIDEIPPEAAAAIQEVYPTANGLRVKFYDKQKSLEALSRILGQYDDGADKVGEKYESLIDKLEKERQSNEKNKSNS